VVAGELPADFVEEAGHVRVAGHQREREEQIRDVVGAVVRQREQEETEPPTDVVGEPADEAEIEQREPPVVGDEHVAAMRIGVVDAP